MSLKTEKASTKKVITATDLTAMEGRAKDFTRQAIEASANLNQEELEMLDKELAASEEEIVIAMKMMELRMKKN